MKKGDTVEIVYSADASIPAAPCLIGKIGVIVDEPGVYTFIVKVGKDEFYELEECELREVQPCPACGKAGCLRDCDEEDWVPRNAEELNDR